jgi:hypothetical protein
VDSSRDFFPVPLSDTLQKSSAEYSSSSTIFVDESTSFAALAVWVPLIFDGLVSVSAVFLNQGGGEPDLSSFLCCGGGGTLGFAVVDVTLEDAAVVFCLSISAALEGKAVAVGFFASVALNGVTVAIGFADDGEDVVVKLEE